MIRFYSPDIESTGVLPPEESAHAVRVLRLREGSDIETVDGDGHSYTCRLVSPDPRGAGVEIIERHDEPKSWNGRLTIAVAPTKNADRMEWFVEKAVEMGVDEIVLLRCEHSERKQIRLDRLGKIMVSAMKQSLKAVLPKLRGMVDISEFVAEKRSGTMVMGYCSDETERRDFTDVYAGAGDLTVLIGPEGDFSPDEVAEAISKGYVLVTFGQQRLRTETAALYGVAGFHLLDGLKK